MSYNPIDYLNKNKSASWQELAAGAFSSSNSNKRKRLLGMGILGFLNVRESKMINETQKNLRKLEASKVLEYGKIENQHKQNQEIVDQFESYRKNPLNYFEIEAEAELDKADPDYWNRVGGVRGRESLTAQDTRTNDITGLATSKMNALFSKMGYRTNEKGEYEIDVNTNLPKILTQDDPTTEKVNERDIRRAEILKRKSLAEAQQPYNAYFAAKQEEIMQPKNISWAGKVLDKASSFFRKNKGGEETAIEIEAKNLLTNYNESYKDASVHLNNDVVPLTVNGKSIYDLVDAAGDDIVSKPFQYTKLKREAVTFTLEEAEQRLWSQPNTELPLTEKKAISKALKNLKFEFEKDNKGKTFRITEPNFRAQILVRKQDYNQFIAQTEERLVAFDSSYANEVDPKTLKLFNIDLKSVDPRSGTKNEVYKDGRVWLSDTIGMTQIQRQEAMTDWNNTQKRVWKRYKYARNNTSRAFRSQEKDPIRDRLQKVDLLIGRYQAQLEASAAEQDPIYTEAELNAIKSMVVDLSANDIDTALAARSASYIADPIAKTLRTNKFSNPNKTDAFVTIYDEELKKEVRVYNEVQWQAVVTKNYNIHAVAISNEIFKQRINPR